MEHLPKPYWLGKPCVLIKPVNGYFLSLHTFFTEVVILKRLAPEQLLAPLR